jgi:hypothetical protein
MALLSGARAAAATCMDPLPRADDLPGSALQVSATLVPARTRASTSRGGISRFMNRYPGYTTPEPYPDSYTCQ